MKQFKIRASSAGNITADAVGTITEKQLIQLKELEDKEKPTVKQQEKIVELRAKRDAQPELPETAKTYCKDWLKVQLYNRRQEVKTKYMDKGLIMEDESIDFVADQLGYPMLFKNEQNFTNDYITGTPDIIIKSDKLIIDVKNSWSPFTFPLFENEVPSKDYYWQAQCYLDLLGFDNFKLIYVLSDTPLHLIEREARWYCTQNGYDANDADIHDKFIHNMTYQDVAPQLKIKTFDIERNDEDITKLKERVLLCRQYIETLLREML